MTYIRFTNGSFNNLVDSRCKEVCVNFDWMSYVVASLDAVQGARLPVLCGGLRCGIPGRLPRALVLGGIGETVNGNARRRHCGRQSPNRK